MTVILVCEDLKAACSCVAASHHIHLSGDHACSWIYQKEVRLKEQQGPKRQNFLHVNIHFRENWKSESGFLHNLSSGLIRGRSNIKFMTTTIARFLLTCSWGLSRSTDHWECRLVTLPVSSFPSLVPPSLPTVIAVAVCWAVFKSQSTLC